MIVCPNCQTENRLGSIFCRSCGAKLAIDDVTVQNFEEKTGAPGKEKKKKKKKKRKVIMGIIRLVFLLLIAFGVFLVFQKPTLPEINTTGDAHDGFKNKMRQMIEADKEGRKVKADFTEEEINSFATQIATAENQGNVQLREIFVDLQDDNGVELFFNADVFGQRIVSSCVGKVSAGSGGLTFTPDGFFAARLGKLPYPMPLFKYMTKNMLDKNGDLTKLLAIITSIEISDDKVEVKVGTE